MTVLGVVIPNGKPANKGFRREDRPDPYSERVEERRCLSDALRDEASETLLRQASAGGDFGPREASAATISRTTAFLDSIRLCGRKADRFPHLAASRAGRQHPPATPPHDRCGGGDVPVLVSYGSRGPYGKGSDIAEPKTFT